MLSMVLVSRLIGVHRSVLGDVWTGLKDVGEAGLMVAAGWTRCLRGFIAYATL